MRIALVNYRYFISGGPERYLFNIKEILEKNGHEVFPFSVQHNNNIVNDYEPYFLTSIGDGSEIYFGDKINRSLIDSIKGFSRMTYSIEARKTFKKFLKKTAPDLVYILYFQNKISCSIIDVAYSMKIPVVQRISDYSLLCPCNILYRNDINEICEKCIHENVLNAIKYKCVYNSSVYSAVKVLAIKIQELVNIKKKIHSFIFPSQFTLDKFKKAQFPQNKLHFVPTLFNHSTINEINNITYEDFALYVGRIDPDKGIKTMIKAFIGTEYSLKIIGFSSTNYQEELNTFLQGKKHNIEFLGKMEFKEIQKYLAHCLFTIIPSEWYDNLPNTLLESMAFKKCVVATNIGSLKENIEDKKNGLLFDYKDSDSLHAKIKYLFDNPEIAKVMGKNANEAVFNKFGIEKHYNSLISIFNKAMNKRNPQQISH